jgi:hypothetical protein
MLRLVIFRMRSPRNGPGEDGNTDEGSDPHVEMVSELENSFENWV